MRIGRPTNPLEAIALQELQREFGNLISVRAQVEDFEYGIISSTLGSVFFRHLKPVERQRWHRTVRAAYYYLDAGTPRKKTREVCEAYVRITESIAPAYNHFNERRAQAENTNGDARVEGFLGAYKAITEELLTAIAAPVVVGFRLVYGVPHNDFKPKPDGRVNLSAIDKMEKWILAPANLLKVGLNSHVRNAYAHNRYRILDGERIEMWDQDRHGSTTWGPEIWGFERVEALCDELSVTCLAIMLAVAIFGMNHRAIISERGWTPKDLPKPPNMRAAEIRSLVEMYADYNSLTLKAFDKNEAGDLRMDFQTHSRGIDQIDRFLLGGPGGSRSYGKRVKYEQRSVAEAVLGLLQRAAQCSDDIATLRATVRDQDSNLLGELVFDSNELSKVRGPKFSSLQMDRKYATLDSLADAQMWARIEGPAEPV